MIKTEQHNLTKSKLEKILSYCEKSFLEQIGEGFNEQLEDVILILKNLAGEAKTYKDKQFFNELYFVLKSSKNEMSIEFKNYLKQYFKEKLEDKINKEDSLLMDNLSLVSESDENIHIEQKKLEHKMLDKLNEEILPLNLRIESLLGENKNPFELKTLIQALTKTIEKHVQDENAKKQIFNAISNKWADNLKSTYQIINGYLISNDVIPDIAKYKSIRSKLHHQNDLHGNANDRHLSQTHLSNHNLPQKNYSSSDFDTSNFSIPDIPNFSSHQNNQQHFQEGEPSDYLNPPTIPGFENVILNELTETQNHLPNPNISKNRSSSRNSRESFISKLNKAFMQIKGLGLNKDEQTINTHIPAYKRKHNNYHQQLIQAIEAKKFAQANGVDYEGSKNGLTPEQLDAYNGLISTKEQSSMLNDLTLGKDFSGYQVYFLEMKLDDIIQEGFKGNIVNKNILAEIAQKSSTDENIDPNETIIVDLLSSVFEKIFEHPKLPIHIKFLISKLQIPILKTSLLDKTFFIYNDNPVRLFLDCLATHETLYNYEYHQKFEIMIDEILNKEEINQEDFVLAIEKIQTIIKAYSSMENNLLQKIMPPISLEEAANEHYEQVLSVIKQKISARTNYEPVVTFVENVWAKAFAQRWTISAQKIESFMDNLPIAGKLSLNQSLLTFEMIILANELKSKTDLNKEKLKLYMPKINDGLDKIAKDLKIDIETINKLKEVLSELHLRFISDVVKSEQQEIDFKKLEKTVSNDFIKIAENVIKISATKKDIEQAKSDFDTIFISGSWFEFIHDKSKMRLVWVSPKQTIYLFNNPEKNKVYKFDKSRVWSYYKSNHIKLLSDEVFGTESIIQTTINKNHKNFEPDEAEHILAL